MAAESGGEVARGAPRSCPRLAILLFVSSACGVTANFEYDGELRVESARLFGNVNQYAYYFTDLLVGSPPQRASVIIDTGSRLVGFPCSECQHCGKHLDPAYDASRSLSLTWQNCTKDCPDACGDDGWRCPYRETYAEGSEIAGMWFEDEVELGDAFSKNPPVRATLGCHTNENKLFYSQRANGIMGLAPTTGVRGRPSFLESLFQDSAHVDTALFSICLATWGGRLSVGGYNDSYHAAAEKGGGISWVSMHASHYYYVTPTGLSLQGASPVQVVIGSTSFGYTIVDSGTTFSYFPEAVYAPLVSAIRLHCEEGRRGCDATAVDKECWQLSGPDAIDQFPPLRFEFPDGAHIDWLPKSYLHDRGDHKTWCLAFQESQATQTVLGISFMLHKDLIFDLAQGRLGVADADCPQYREHPEIEQKFAAGPAIPRLGAGMRFHAAPASEPAGRGHARPRRPVASRLVIVGAVTTLAVASLAVVCARWLRRGCALASALDDETQLARLPLDT
jgi:hypothetical protein